MDGHWYGEHVQFTLPTGTIDPHGEIILECTKTDDATKKTSLFSFDCQAGGCNTNLLTPCVIWTGLPDGLYQCVAQVVDDRDPTLSTLMPGCVPFVITIHIDRNKAANTLSLNPDKSGGWYNASDTNVQVIGGASHPAGIRSWSFTGLINESSVGGPFASPVTVTRSFNASLLANGVYTITWNALPDVGFVVPGVCQDGPPSNPQTKTIQVDSQPPTVTVQSPGTCLKGTVNITFTVDNGSGTQSPLKQIRIFIDNVLVGTPTTSPFSFNTTTLTDGSHTLKVEAEDQAGNIGSASTTFTTDNTIPKVQNVTLNGSSVTLNQCTGQVGATATIAFTLSENCKSWTVTVDGAQIGTGNGSSGSATYTIPDFGNCHTVVITAVDLCNNNSDPVTFQVKRNQHNNCDCVILPNLIWVGTKDVLDPFDGKFHHSYRPEILNIDKFTLQDVLNCNNVPPDGLIVQTVCVQKITPALKCLSYLYGPGSGKNTNFNTGFQYATNADLNKSVIQVAFKLKQLPGLGNRALLFSPPETTYLICVQYVVRDPKTGRTGAPKIVQMCWRVEDSTKDIIRNNIEYFSTVAVGRTQKPKITPEVVAALYAALLIPDDLAALTQFETVLGNTEVDWPAFITPEDVRFKTGYLIDTAEEPIGCLLIEQAAFLLWH